MSGQSDLIRVH